MTSTTRNTLIAVLAILVLLIIVKVAIRQKRQENVNSPGTIQQNSTTGTNAGENVNTGVVPPAENTNTGAGTPVNTNTSSGKNTNTGSSANTNVSAGKNTNSGTGNTNVPVSSGKSSYGVMVSAGTREDGAAYAKELGASWIRINVGVNGSADATKAVKYLDAGMHAVITLNYRNASNIDTTYGTTSEWANGGFPYKDKATYQKDVQNALKPVTGYLAKGRQIMVQAENEVGDAKVSSESKYWRGTTDQYLTQLDALHDAVKELNGSYKVVLSGFTDGAEESVLTPGTQKYNYQVSRMSTMLASPDYDYADLHFYGCSDTIAAKATWVKDHQPAGKGWIATEIGGPMPNYCGYVDWHTDLAGFEKAQADQVATRLSACSANGGTVCLWFSLFNLNGEVDSFNHLGLLTQEQTPQKKPAFDAFKSFVGSR